MEKNKTFISIVIPVYNEEHVMPQSYLRLTNVMKSVDIFYEIIYVNDGSKDNTVQILSDICKKDKHIRVIDLSRNFGQMASISAGLQYACGDAVVIIDADLQDPPEVILQMIEKWREGYDVVYGKRIRRKNETMYKKAVSKLFFRVLKMLCDVEVPLDSGDFRLIDRKVRDILVSLPERNRFMRGLISWLGFKQIGVEYVREGRFAGKTKYARGKLLNLAINGFTSMTYKPLRLPFFVGMVSFILCLAGTTIYIANALMLNKAVVFVELFLFINLMFSSFILIILGLKGEYIGKMYEEIKGRPIYIVKDKIGYENNDAILKRIENK